LQSSTFLKFLKYKIFANLYKFKFLQIYKI
jgi:hypothetical protein